MRAGRKEEQTNLHRVGSGRAVEVWWAREGPHAEMEGSSQGHEETDKGNPLTVLQLFPSTNPCSILWLFIFPTKILSGHADLGLCCLSGLTTKSPEDAFCGSPQAHLPVVRAYIPHCGPSPLAGFTEEGKVFEAKTVMSACYNAQALSPQDTLEV